MNKLIEIKHRFSGKVIFSLECESIKICLEAAITARANLSGADLSGANLSRSDLSGADLSGASLHGANLSRADLYGANLYGADLSRANLSRANLYGADLSRSDLSGANLSRANLYGADLSGADGERKTIKQTPLQIIGLRWPVIIFDDDMKIGCEYHAIKDWWSYDDGRISEMEKNALGFWKANKSFLISICENNGRGTK